MNRPNVFESLLDVVGNTPMVKIKRMFNGGMERTGSEVFAKLEFLNPMGSVKDRIAKYMIEKAEKEGLIKNGQLIIENSSGNTALGLALVAIQKGYKLKVVVRDTISPEKSDQLKALGVDIVRADTSLHPSHAESYNNLAHKIVEETPGSYFPDQHESSDNMEAHYKTTGPEIWEQMEGKIDYLIGGIGTGGTICGVSKYLKEQDPSIKVIAMDPIGSVFYDYFHTGKVTEPSGYLLEGLGDEFIIGSIDFKYIDDIWKVTDQQSFTMARRLVKEEGVMAGGSSGSAMFGVQKLLNQLDKTARIVTIFPDSASRYLSTVFNDDWMEKNSLKV